MPEQTETVEEFRAGIDDALIPALSDAPEDAFRSLGGGPRPSRTVVPISGREWAVLTGDDARPVWVLDLDDVRVAVTGARISPPLFESMELLGRERSLSRLQSALA